MTPPARRGHIPFNRPRAVGSEYAYISEAIARGQLSAGGDFTARCCEWLETQTGSAKALLVHSATAALEMAALLLDIEDGDEVIIPSFAFVSAANAVVLRGGTPVFVDIRPDTLNLDERLVEMAITARTKAIMPIHYAGVPCEMDAICEIARKRGVFVVEDAAQALGSMYKGRSAGSLADLSAISFHETKNVISGEGGALLINDDRFSERGEVIRDKGTDRGRFARGEVEKYSWVDVGSSYGMSELNAAFLWAQLEQAGDLQRERLRLWHLYHEGLEALEDDGFIRRPLSPDHVQHNAHIYYLLLEDSAIRERVLGELNASDVNAVFHFVPLHQARAGRRYGRLSAPLLVTEDVWKRLIRLPLWNGMTDDQVLFIIDALGDSLRRSVDRGSSVRAPEPATRHSQ